MGNAAHRKTWVLSVGKREGLPADLGVPLRTHSRLPIGVSPYAHTPGYDIFPPRRKILCLVCSTDVNNDNPSSTDDVYWPINSFSNSFSCVS